jgi:hypothetical protein
MRTNEESLLMFLPQDEEAYWEMMNPTPLATPADALREFAANAGRENPDWAWLLHDWDVWVANPFYQGPPVRHPEDDDGFGETSPMTPAPEFEEDNIPF